MVQVAAGLPTLQHILNGVTIGWAVLGAAGFLFQALYFCFDFVALVLKAKVIVLSGVSF